MTEQISMIELFSGIGAQERALRQFGLPYEVKHTCDCDKDATLSYATMRWDLEKEMETFDFPSQEQMIEELQEKNLGYDFQKSKHTITSRTPIDKLKQYYIADKLSKNLGDISKVERLPYVDFWTYSYPCTDLSVAGKGEGMVNKCDKCGCTWAINFEDPKTNNICPDCGNIDIKSTRSGLLGQVQRLLTVSYEEGTLPRYLLLENVKNLVGKKFKPQFDAWVNWLDLIGYNTYYKVLNAKHYGIPQNRERIFAISIRKDVDTKGYIFPEQIPLEMRLKDILEKDVDEKYYLPDDRIEKILNSTFMQEKKRIQTTDVCDTLLARDYKDPKCVPVEDLNPVRLGGLYDTENGKHQAGAIWDKDAISPTLDTMQGGNRQPYIVDEIKVVGNYMPSNHDASRVVDIDGIAPTVKENHGTVTAIAEPFIVASRGRNPENPSDRTVGIKTEQRLEPNKEGICNCITSVQKDSYVVEPVTEKQSRVHLGARFGRLVVIRDTGKKQGTNHIWECKCDCGNICEVNTGRLGSTTNSCGCLKIDSHRTHNMTNTRLYNIWTLMKRRCFSKTSPNYKDYGARGITVCDEWLQFENFYEWAINNGYREDLTIERSNNDGHYEPSNCKWADLTTQVNNRRNWGEVEYYGIVKDNTGYRAQVTVNGKKIYIAHSTNDIEYLVNERNKYIDEHNLPNKKNVFKKSSKVELEPIIYDDYNSRISADQDAINTLTCNCGASAERNGVKIIEAELKMENIVFPVMVRKYDVDCKLLCECLRDHKDASNFSNNDIADALNIPLTKVEHWFRRDDSFAIPDPDVWPKLKELLGITTNEFDESIMTFEIKDGVYDKSNRCYHIDGIAPTLTAASANEKIIEPVIIEDFYQSREPRIYTETAPTIRSERTGLKAADGEIEYPCSTRGKQVASAIRASIYKQGARNLEENVVNGLGYEGVIEQEEPKIRWRIRKLTAKECWRLMDFTDNDVDRASTFVSDSSLYKQAGNSICVCCLIGLMSSLFIEDGHKAEVWTKYALHFND